MWLKERQSTLINSFKKITADCYGSSSSSISVPFSRWMARKDIVARPKRDETGKFLPRRLKKDRFQFLNVSLDTTTFS